MLRKVDTAPCYHSWVGAIRSRSLTPPLGNFYSNYSSLEYLRLSMRYRGLRQAVGARRS